MNLHMTRRLACLAIFLGLAVPHDVAAQRQPPLPVVTEVDWQPLGAQVRRLIQAREYVGDPLPDEIVAGLREAARLEPAEAVARVQQLLDPLVLLDVHISPESRVKVHAGPAEKLLTQNGWRVFLVKVHNKAGVTAKLQCTSPNAASLHNSPESEVVDRWLDLVMLDGQPLTPTLTGLELEYRLISLYSRDAGKRDAKFAMDVGQGTQDLGFRNEVDMVFDCQPANSLTLHVVDENGVPTTGCFEIRDSLGRVYPSQSKRLAPDFAFHPQVYRGDGEQLKLPAGEYQVRFWRGPESIPETRTVTIGNADAEASFQVKRWIDPSLSGWWSGDHHIHAAGCAHYARPTQGVHAPDMMRHCLGEDLKVGCNLTWGPCFDYQKQFFTGQIDEVSKPPYLLRYDVEVSGFGSHQSGHLCLLRLKEQIPQGGDSTHHWPTLCLNTLKWAKQQGAVVGPAHTGWGLQISDDQLPSNEVPPYDGIGANEFIVDVTHEVPGPDEALVPAVDFLSMVDTPYVWELNIWYHVLNCGFRTRISGETDFPCIYGERVGLGRSYVKLAGALSFDAWCEGLRQGANYVGDGRSHLIDFSVTDSDGNQVTMGQNESELSLDDAQQVTVTATAAAYLPEEPDAELANLHYTQKPYWHIERARIDTSRTVPVELIVNGEPVARQEIVADGSPHEVKFVVAIDHSSWLALRILPSSHTNPVFVLVDDQPIRASRESAQWCLDSVARCRASKRRFIAPDEVEDFEHAYGHAERTYSRILEESKE